MSNTQQNHLNKCLTIARDAFSAMRSYKLSSAKCSEYLKEKLYQHNSFKRLNGYNQMYLAGVVDTLWDVNRTYYLEWCHVLNGRVIEAFQVEKESDWPGWKEFSDRIKAAENTDSPLSAFYWKEPNHKGEKVRYSP